MSGWAVRWTASRGFQSAVLVVIALSAVLAGLETNAGLIARWGDAFYALDRAVVAFFTAEIALRILAHGRQPWRFFRDGWNVFDFVIVAICLLPFGGQFAMVLRLTRLARALRLVSALPRLQLLVGALLKSLRAMGYVGLLLALMFYIYGVAGVHLFGRNDPVNFGSLAASVLTLFRVITLENWGTYFDTQFYGHEPAVVARPVAAAAFFVSFILLGTMIMLNLFIGIIMNSMSEMHKELEASQAGPADTRDLGSVEARLESLLTDVRALRKERTPT